MSDEQRQHERQVQVAAPEQPKKPKPAWGDPVDSISPDRQAQLRRLADWQREWAAEDTPDLKLSMFMDVPLTGAEVFFLTAYALDRSGGTSDGIEQAAERLLDRTNWYRLNQFDHPALHLEGARLDDDDLTGAYLAHSNLTSTSFWNADLSHSSLSGATLIRAGLNNAYLINADLSDANLSGAFVNDSDLSGANLSGAILSDAILSHMRLRGALLGDVRLDGADLTGADLSGARLSGATMDGKTLLTSTILAAPLSWRDRLFVWRRRSRNTSVALGDIRWGGVGTVDLTAVQWGAVERLGDERGVGLRADVGYHERVVRAYRQLAAQLRAQGMSEVADRFALRAQIRQRGVLLRSFRLPQYLGSWFLAILAGYGYRPGRTIFWYLMVIASFAYAYFQATHGLPVGPLHFAQSTDIQPLPWNEALILSVSAFHGRGFFQPVKSLGDPVAGLAALEAVIGLLIEISFIATFTQRFFGTK